MKGGTYTMSSFALIGLLLQEINRLNAEVQSLKDRLDKD